MAENSIKLWEDNNQRMFYPQVELKVVGELIQLKFPKNQNLRDLTIGAKQLLY